MVMAHVHGDGDGDVPVYLPHFADEEVRALNDLVIQSQKALLHVEESIQEQDDRTTAMEQHMWRLEQEICRTQCCSDAKRREIATEEHLKKLSEMEVARVQRDILRIQKENEETISSVHALTASMFKANEKMEQFQYLMQWNKEELDQWSKAAEQKDEDNFAIQMYTKTDNAKLKELYLEAEKASTDVCTLQQVLDAEVTSTQSAQIELDKTAEVFKTLHNERKDLIQLWEDAVDTIHKRDEAIHKTAEDFAKKKSQLRQEKHQLDELAEKLAKEILMNNELEKQVISKEEESVKAQEYFQKESASMKEAEHELLLMKKNLELATAQLSTSKSQKRQADEELEKKKAKLDELSKKLQQTRHKVEDEYALLDTLDKKRQELERILTEEEANLSSAKKEVHLVKEKHYEASSKLGTLCEKEKDTIYEIKGSNTQSTALTHKIHHMEENVLKLDEMLYSADFEIQCLERKVARASGERSNLESKELKEKMMDLEKEHEDRKSEETLVISQIKKAEDDGRAAKRKNEELLKKLSDFEDKTSELTLASETGLLAVKSMVKEKEEKMLARDLLQMEVNRLHGILNIKTDTVYGMEDMRKRLKMGMEEKKQEVESRLKNQCKELKMLQQQIHCLGLQKRKLYIYCEKLQAKYEAVLKRTKFEDGQIRSPQHFLEKAEKERNLIQEQGYKLEQQVNQVEQEIQILEAAMEDVKEANELLRHSHRTPKMMKLANEEIKLKEELEQAQEALREREKLENNLVNDVTKLEESLQNLQSEHATMLDYLKALEQEVEVTYKEAEEQNEKYKRAKAQLTKLEKEMKSTHGDEVDKFNKEMHLVELSLATNEALYKLKALTNDYPDYGKMIEDKIIGAGFSIPHAASSVRSSRSSVTSMSSRASPRSFSSRRSSSSIAGSARSSKSGAVINLELGEESR